jgi:hypothetical protein
MRRKKGGQIWPMAMYYPGHLGGSSLGINRQKMSYCNAKLMCLFNFLNVVLSMQEHVPDEGPRDAAALLSRPGEGLVGGTRHHKKGLQVKFVFY